MEQKNISDLHFDALPNELAESFFFQVNRMRKAIHRAISSLINEAGINLQMEQLPLIVILKRFKTLSQRELSDITLRDKSSILRSINALQKKGIVVIEQNVNDKRKHNIRLSETGTELADKIRKLYKKAEDDLLLVFTEQERSVARKNIKSYADKFENL